MSAPKTVTRKMIIDGAVALVKERGMDALNARNLAKRLNCSTRPIYLSFSGMEELKGEVVTAITEIFQGYLQREAAGGKYPEYKAYGMAYVKFAACEGKLFCYLFMRDRRGENPCGDGGDMSKVFAALKDSTSLSGEKAELFHAESWIFVHGIATMLATGYLNLTEEQISALVTDMYMGLRARHVKEGG